METQNKDEKINIMNALRDKADKIYDKAELAEKAAKKALKIGQVEEHDKLMSEYYKLTKRHLNLFKPMFKMTRELIKERCFEKAVLLYSEQCKESGNIPEQPILKDCTSGEKYFYLKKDGKVLAKFENKLF